MQAILTKVLPVTNTRGPRIKATCAAGSITIDYPDNLAPGEDCHRVAAHALCAKLATTGGKPWLQPMAAGTLHTGEWVFVFIKQS